MKAKFLLVLFLSAAFTATAQPDLKKLDVYYAKALKDWDVPGMSIAIVKDGKVIFAKGYGVKEAGKNEAPDENTLYAIASNTKSMTAAMIAQLVEEGKLGWNDKVKKYLPYFELYDPYVSAETTIRDILSHRVGLATFSGDIVSYRTTLSAEELVKKAKYLPRAYDFRSGYGYSNVMYLTAGEVIKQITGKTWGQNINERLLGPLKMTRTVWSTNDIRSKGNAASPHGLFDDVHKPIEWENWETIGAMGGIISSVKDMSQWMIMNLNNGVYNSDTLFSIASRNIMWTPHNSYTVDHTDADNAVHFRGYALGWTIGDYYGKLRVGHTGGYSGMLSAVTLIPDEKLGVVVLTNGMKPIFGPLVNYTVDAFLKAPAKDWSGEALANYTKNKDTRIEERKKARVTNTKPSVDISKYVGEYLAAAYGKIYVTNDGGKFRIRFEHTPDLSATLEHWHYDVWKMTWEKSDPLTWFQHATVKFELDNNNNVTGLSFDIPNDDFWFDELKSQKVK
jgi:CubicO group peptidase (beta-lactamase class C family)